MLVRYNNKWYAWFQIQGIGIVKDSPMKDVALKFIDWILSNEVQSLVIENDIMLPASEEILNNLPEDLLNVMKFNISRIKPVNNLIPVSEIYENIDGWLREWKEIISPGFEWIWIAIVSIIVIAVIAGFVVIKYGRKK